MRAAAALRRAASRFRPPPRAVPASLVWVDEWARNVRPFVFVREEDAVLIRRPNEIRKLNPRGAALLAALFAGAPIGEALDAIGRSPDRLRDVARFLGDVRRSLRDELDEFGTSSAVEIRPAERNPTSLPVLSEIAVTYRCNLRCVFCYAGCNRAAPPIAGGKEMTDREVRRVLRSIWRDARSPTVSFTGGEPTLREELRGWIGHAKRLGFRVNLITNGTRLDAAEAARLSRAGLDSAQVSLEGVTAATHDAVTGVRGSFERTVRGVRALRDAGLRVHTNTTLCRGNVEEAKAFPGFVRDELELRRFSMNLMIPAGSGARDPGLAVSYSEIGSRIEAIRAASRAAGVEFLWYSPVPMCLYNTVARGLGNKGCGACDGLLSVAADGSVLPCSAWPEPVGHLLRDGFLETWGSAAARRHREKAHAPERCTSCEHLDVCHGACPLYWDRLGTGELDAAGTAAAPGGGAS